MSALTDEAVRADLAEQAATIVARYPAGRSRSALLPLLHLVQSVDGYVSPEGIGFCAEQLGLTKAEVGAVATFYTMYKRRPTGDYLVSVCTNTMCGVLGGDKAYEALSEFLEVGHDQTTADGLITLEHAECLAACDYAPVMTVNYEYFDQVDDTSALDLVRGLQRGELPLPTRGARLCSFKETSRQLAGFADLRNGAVGDSATGEPTMAGNRLAEIRAVSVPGFDPDTPIGKKQSDKPAEKPAERPAAPAAVLDAPVEKPAEKPADAPPAAAPTARTRRRTSSTLASASSEPGAKRPARRAPARRPGTERSAPAVADAAAAPAESSSAQPGGPTVENEAAKAPTEPAEQPSTETEPAVDSKPAGDAAPADPRSNPSNQSAHNSTESPEGDK